MLTQEDKELYDRLDKELKIIHFHVDIKTKSGYNTVMRSDEKPFFFFEAQREMLMNYRALGYIPQFGDFIKCDNNIRDLESDFVIVGKDFNHEEFGDVSIIVIPENDYNNFLFGR